MVAVPESRPRSRAEEDLRWYFEVAEGAQGVPSNYPPMVLRIQYGAKALPVATAGSIDESRLDAVYRARRIEAALAGAGQEAATVLYLAFGAPRQRDLKAYGELGNLVLGSPAAIAAHLRSGSTRKLAEWLGRLPRRAPQDPAAARLLDQLNIEANNLLTQAIVAYRSAVRRGGLHG